MTQPLIPFAIHKDTGKVVDISSVDAGLNFIWHGHEYNNLCEECCSPLMVLRNPVS